MRKLPLHGILGTFCLVEVIRLRLRSEPSWLGLRLDGLGYIYVTVTSLQKFCVATNDSVSWKGWITPLQILACRKIFFLSEISSKNKKWGLEIPIWGGYRGKVNTASTHNLLCWKFPADCRKIPTFCHTGWHSVTCHPTRVNVPHLNPSQTGLYLIYLPQRDGRPWPWWSVTQRYGLPVHPWPLHCKPNILIITPPSHLALYKRIYLLISYKPATTCRWCTGQCNGSPTWFWVCPNSCPILRCLWSKVYQFMTPHVTTH